MKYRGNCYPAIASDGVMSLRYKLPACLFCSGRIEGYIYLYRVCASFVLAAGNISALNFSGLQTFP